KVEPPSSTRCGSPVILNIVPCTLRGVCSRGAVGEPPDERLGRGSRIDRDLRTSELHELTGRPGIVVARPEQNGHPGGGRLEYRVQPRIVEPSPHARHG